MAVLSLKAMITHDCIDMEFWGHVSLTFSVYKLAENFFLASLWHFSMSNFFFLIFVKYQIEIQKCQVS